MTRRDLLKRGLHSGLAASLTSGLWLAGCRKERPAARHANLILVSIDTLRADHLGCHGYSRPTSPALDKIASEGLLFEDVTAPSPWTLPAHASLLTGLYPSRHGVRSHSHCLPDDAVTLAERLEEHGFLTAAVVNSHNLCEKYGLHRGFDDFTYVKEDLKQVKPSRVEDEALRWLLERRGERFFLFLHYYDVHSDYRSLPQYEKQFVRPYQGNADGSTAQLLAYRYGHLSLNRADIEHLLNLYDASIRQMDDGLARLFKFLEDRDLLDNTLLVITSDHGEEFLEHGGVLHGRTQYQEVLQVPLVMRGPGIPQSTRVKDIASLVDVMPTILAMLGVPDPLPSDGIDLRFLWEKVDVQPAPRFIFGEADHNNEVEGRRVEDIKRAVRHPRYKLHYDRLTKESQLYDLLEDPHEKFDVASAHTSLGDLLLDRLAEFMRVDKIGKASSPLTPQETETLKSLGYL